ncbi:hypothetical protein CMI37_09900 [Candidatus Pacearchaeota archaeon]|nr:hypothetical protein [Candidatus Pacearchaeota archaeon]
MAYKRKKGGQRLMELAGTDFASKNAALKRKRAKQKALRIAKNMGKAIDKAKSSGKTIRHGNTKITVNGKPSPHLTGSRKPTATKKTTTPKPAPKPTTRIKPTAKKPLGAYAKLLEADKTKGFAKGGVGARGGGTISPSKTNWKERLSGLKHHVLQKTIPATGRALERFEEDLGSIAHAVGLRKSDKPVRIANVPSTKKSATGLDVLVTLGGLGLAPPLKVVKAVTPARVLAEKGGKIKQAVSKIIPKEVKKFYQKHLGSRLSPKMQITPTKSGAGLGTTTEITTRGLAFGAGRGASKVNEKIKSEAKKVVARINKASRTRSGQKRKEPLTVAEFLKAVMNVKPKVVPKPRQLTHTPATKPRVFNMGTTAKPKPKPRPKTPPKWQSATDKPKISKAEQKRIDAVRSLEQQKSARIEKGYKKFAEDAKTRSRKAASESLTSASGKPAKKVAKKTTKKPAAKKKTPAKKTPIKKAVKKRRQGQKGGQQLVKKAAKKKAAKKGK